MRGTKGRGPRSGSVFAVRLQAEGRADLVHLAQAASSYIPLPCRPAAPHTQSQPCSWPSMELSSRDIPEEAANSAQLSDLTEIQPFTAGMCAFMCCTFVGLYFHVFSCACQSNALKLFHSNVYIIIC